MIRAGEEKIQVGTEIDAARDGGRNQTIGCDWKFAAISLGFPSPVRNGKIVSEPKHLGQRLGRIRFRKSVGKRVRIINDASMQALGSYHGGRMLFLGLGTGLGSALVWTIMFSRSNWAICLIATAASLRIILAKPARRDSVRKLAARCPARPRPIEEIAHCRLHRARRWKCKE